MSPKLPRSATSIFKIPDSLNWPTVLVAACSYSPLSIVVDLWSYVKSLGFDPCWCPECSRALSKLLTDISAQVYSTIASHTAITRSRSHLLTKRRDLCSEDIITDLPTLIHRIVTPVQLLGPFVANEPYFYTILCRLLAYVLKQESPDFLEIQEIARNLYRTVLIPSLSLSAPNPSIHHEIWSGLQYLHQSLRFKLYDYWQSLEIASNADLFYGMKWNYLGIDYYLRRLAVGNVDELTKILTYFGFSTPLYLFRLLLRKCATYDNLIQLIVPKLKCISSLAVDVCCFCIVEYIQNRESKLQNNQVSYDPGFDLATDFTSNFVKLFSERIDLSMMLTHVENCLRNSDISSLLLVSKLLTSVANVLFISLSKLDSIPAGHDITSRFNDNCSLSFRIIDLGPGYNVVFTRGHVGEESRAIDSVLVFARSISIACTLSTSTCWRDGMGE